MIGLLEPKGQSMMGTDQDDVVLMPAGYHPNVGAPGFPINFLWMMAALREDVDRQYGVVNVQPDFATTPSGLDAGRAGTR